MEEQLPFYGLWFPQWFYKKHPHVETSINSNEDLLSSGFDVYETLKDILDSNYNGSQRPTVSRGQSQLYPLPKNRTCSSAGIPNRFCTCLKSNPVQLDDPHIINAAEAMVLSLNSLLQNVSDICHKINFSKILYVAELGFQETEKITGSHKSSFLWKLKRKLMGYGKQDGRKLEIGIETEPNKATFEAVLKFDKKWIVESEISRTSKYAGFSDCVNVKYLKNYCSCIANKNYL